MVKDKHPVFTKDRVRRMQRDILRWYKAHGRHDLPWRKNPTPYRVLVSEFMLQQTQVSRVVPKYSAFLNTYPTPRTLASASSADVLRAWSGLGYNRRAVHLHRAVIAVVREHRGRFPKTAEGLRRLSGVGHYTAAALRVFAWNLDDVAIDTNVRRVLHHELRLSPSVSDKQLSEIAWQVLPRGRAREWHSAIMDYGSAVVTAKRMGKSVAKKQAKFKGSVREVRGWIVRILAVEGPQSLPTLVTLSPFPADRLKLALEGLMRDKLVTKTKQKIHLGG